MHEFSTAKGILDTVLSAVEEYGATEILEVVVEVGDLTALNHEQPRFSFEAPAERTAAGKAMFVKSRWSVGSEVYVRPFPQEEGT